MRYRSTAFVWKKKWLGVGAMQRIFGRYHLLIRNSDAGHAMLSTVMAPQKNTQSRKKKMRLGTGHDINSIRRCRIHVWAIVYCVNFWFPSNARTIILMDVRKAIMANTNSHVQLAGAEQWPDICAWCCFLQPYFRNHWMLQLFSPLILPCCFCCCLGTNNNVWSLEQNETYIY